MLNTSRWAVGKNVIRALLPKQLAWSSLGTSGRPRRLHELSLKVKPVNT